jgi:hypothetical protein
VRRWALIVDLRRFGVGEHTAAGEEAHVIKLDYGKIVATGETAEEAIAPFATVEPKRAVERTASA